MLMGVIHNISTFTPLIADKLAPLSERSQQAFTYFSLMCGALLMVGGAITYLLSDKVTEYPFIRKPYQLGILTLAADGILAAYFMPHNPFAWMIFVLTLLLPLANIKAFN